MSLKKILLALLLVLPMLVLAQYSYPRQGNGVQDPTQDITDALRNGFSYGEKKMGNASTALTNIFDTVKKQRQDFFDVLRKAMSALCIAFLIFKLFSRLAGTNKKTESELEDSRKKSGFMPINGWYILSCIGLIFGIIFYIDLFNWLDKALLSMSNTITANNSYAKEVWEDAMKAFMVQVARERVGELVEAGSNISILGFNFSGAGQAASVFVVPNRFVYAFCALGTVAGFINYIMGAVAYVDREFALLIIDFFAPLVFALTILESYRHLAVRFFMILIGVYLVFPFIMVGFHIADLIYVKFGSLLGIITTTGVDVELENIAGIGRAVTRSSAHAIDRAARMYNYDIFIKFPLLIVVIFLKFKFLKLTTQMVWKILG